MRRLGISSIVLVVASGLAACGGGAAPGGGPDGGGGGGGDDDGAAPDGGPSRPPAVIVMIGDGMGTAQLDAASLYAHGDVGRLAMQALPHVGELRTGGPSGITDSAAAATVIATGVYTYNGRVAVDRAGAPVETVLERAAARGWATGVVTTTSLAHATPAGFTAHAASRHDYAEIMAEQVGVTRPDVMLGGGAQHLGDAALDGWTVVADAAELAAAGGATRLFGAFAPEHLTYVADRDEETVEPTLPEMARAALAALDQDPDGFFLMIEGGRIDHGGHANDLVDVVHETLAFDETIAEVTAWARARGNTTVIVTADHECGGLAIVEAGAAGEYPEVTWRWDHHTNARVGIFGEGPGTEVFDGAVVDHRWVHAIARARIDGDAFVEPAREPIPDGELGDLRHRAVVQAVPSGFGAGFNQLDALWLDAGAEGLSIGVEGVFEWDENAVEIWIDVDFGAATGPGGLAGAIDDTSGAADAVLAASTVSAPAVEGFGVDLVIVSIGGADPRRGDRLDEAGLRGVRAPYGDDDDLGWGATTINFGAVRTRGAPIAARPGEGMEVLIPWDELYPSGVPAGARVAVAAVLVNSDGGYTSNQMLPPLPAEAPNPGRDGVALPGVVVYELDDGGSAPPVVVAP